MIYLDFNATTPVLPTVFELMKPWFCEAFGNPSSRQHAWGWKADEAVKQAREQLAQLLGAKPDEVVFTSGATEACNLAIKGLAQHASPDRRRILCLKTEHKAVLDTVRFLESVGFEVEWIAVDHDGQPDWEQLQQALERPTLMVCAMLANNETGVIHDIPRLARYCRDASTLLFCDATQALGKIPVDVQQLGVDLLACSAHKMYGPKGSGALYIRRSSRHIALVPLLHGGGQESGLRAGTLNVPAIVGMGAAAAHAMKTQEAQHIQMLQWRTHWEQHLRAQGALITAQNSVRLPNTLHFRVPGIRASEWIAALPQLGIATGSACSSGNGQPSHVALAMGMTSVQASECLRISFGTTLKKHEPEEALQMVQQALSRFRSA